MLGYHVSRPIYYKYRAPLYSSLERVHRVHSLVHAVRPSLLLSGGLAGMFPHAFATRCPFRKSCASMFWARQGVNSWAGSPHVALSLLYEGYCPCLCLLRVRSPSLLRNMPVWSHLCAPIPPPKRWPFAVA